MTTKEAFEAWASGYGFHAEQGDVHQYAQDCAGTAWQAALAAHPSASPEGAEPLGFIIPTLLEEELAKGRSIVLWPKKAGMATMAVFAHPLRSVPVAEAVMTNGDFHCPACGQVMKDPTHCGSCLWERDTCGYDIADERAAFAQAMVDAGYGRPEFGPFDDSQFRYGRDADRFVGWKLARDATPPAADTLADANQPAGIEGQIAHLIHCVREDVLAHDGKLAGRSQLAEDRLKVLIGLAVKNAAASTPAAGVPQYELLEDKNGDKQLYYCSETYKTLFATFARGVSDEERETCARLLTTPASVQPPVALTDQQMFDLYYHAAHDPLDGWKAKLAKLLAKQTPVAVLTENGKPASTYFRAGRNQGSQEAISACDSVDLVGADDCIKAIRALSTGEATS